MNGGLRRVHAYLQALPNGVASYPECRAKASVYREALAWRPLPKTIAGLPPELLELVASPPPMSAWISEVQAMAMGLAIADHHGLSDREFVTMIYDLGRTLLNSPTYRYLMTADDLGAMLKHAHVRWTAMHQGIGLKADEVGEHGCAFQMTFPARLYDELLLKAYAATFRAGLDMTGKAGIEVELTGFGDTSAQFAARW
ncbi:MAG TPA: hypothetical protein VGK67_20210 [Myxococcales bacterium]|jgi:hypothetical protein